MYTVLARKYRPKNFSELVGQPHIVRALSNAFTQERLHHAYLFSGTRGVGKTTLGRIIAKCLNCHEGISATPCGVCTSCTEIDNNRSMDLVEIDAASNTKVEDTRTLLDNVQYAPTRDRFKIYLIDEVHMLSGHSFNALLKTLEEPPEYVKFILATTDPQKLPVTILSRCLQFNLKPIPETIIVEKLTKVLKEETISAEPPALEALAIAARGSLRDALSLLDQAIAYGDGHVLEKDVHAMLGLLGSQALYELLTHLASNHAQAAIHFVDQLAADGADFHQICLELINALQAIARHQLLPDEQAPEPLRDLSEKFDKETIQLFYQILLTGTRDLPLAPSPRTGFTMLVLRLLAFAPASHEPVKIVESIATPNTSVKKTAEPTKQTIDNWPSFITQMTITGMTKALADHCHLAEQTEESITLELDPSHTAMANNTQQKRLQEAITAQLGRPIQLLIKPCKPSAPTPAKQQAQKIEKDIESAHEQLNSDTDFSRLKNAFSAEVLPDTIKPCK